MLKIKTKAIFVLCFTKFTTVSSQTLHCDPLDNVYYHKQLAECMKCETCPVGYGKVTIEESGIEIDLPFGSSSCIPCRPCKQGFYSDVNAYKCKLCTNCTELNKSERISCTSKQDTVCGEQVLIGAIDVVKKVKRKDESHESTNADRSNPVKTAIIISVLAMMICCGGLWVGYVGYRRWKSKRVVLIIHIVLVATDTILNKERVKSTSDSGVCFYGATAERVLNILAKRDDRLFLPSVRKPKDCSDLDPKHDPSGVYIIYPTAGRGFKVYCDMKTDGGRWTVLIKRMDGSQNFNKKWKEYENGFGDLNREFWLGNKYLTILTSTGKTEMRVDMKNFNGEKRYAKYSTFKVGFAASKYKLTIGGFNGDAGDSLSYHNGRKFTTLDQDNDSLGGKNCALQKNRVGGGWWYGGCENACFTLSYANNNKGLTGEALIQWEHWQSSAYSLKYASMMIRRV